VLRESGVSKTAPHIPHHAPDSPVSPWYADGLRFACTQCGRCCGGAPGYVWVTSDEIAALARRLGLPVEAFRKRHVRDVGVRQSLRELPNGDCEFLRRSPDGKARCTVYEARPLQCRTWPFWRENLRSAQAWALAAENCPGMNHGTHHPLPVIQDALAGV
jgi:Fe-S-cluster containining protein